MLKLLIFDLDGTLADTARDITDALNYALKPYVDRQYSIEETKSMVGSGISNLLASLVPPQGNKQADNQASEEVVDRFLHHYDKHLTVHTSLYPNVNETLSELKEFKKSVLSNKREKYSLQILEELGIAGHFDLVWGSDSVKEKKPSPVPILDMIKEFGVSIDEAAIIGDSNYDVEAGKAAGIKVVAVTYGFRSIEFLRDADYIVDSFKDLAHIVAKMQAGD